MNNDLIINFIELLGTFAFAISGIRHAAAKHFDWFGGYVCGVAVAIGGGTIRDVMLGTTPFWMTTPIYLICTAVALLTVVFFGKWTSFYFHLVLIMLNLSTCFLLRHKIKYNPLY